MIDVVAMAEQALHHCRISFRRFSVIVLDRSHLAETGVALLVFVDGGRQPRIFIKATSNPLRGRAVAREFETITRLRQLGSAGFRAALPSPLWFGEWNGCAVLVEVAEPGPRMKDRAPNSYFRSSWFRRDFVRVTDWLLEFARIGEAVLPEGSNSVPWNTLAEELATYRSRFRVSNALEALFDCAVDTLQRRPVRLLAGHGDFCSANILLPARDRICVIDWEQPLSPSWPLQDLLYFFCSIWCVPYRAGFEAQRANYRELFFGRHRLSGLIQKAGLRYARELGLESQALVPLSVATWLVYANRKRGELQTEGRLQAPAGWMDERRTSWWPLILLDQESCWNLELLAQMPDRYVFAPQAAGITRA